MGSAIGFFAAIVSTLVPVSMLNHSEFTALYSKFRCNVVMMPCKIKNMIWDTFTSSVSFYILFMFFCWYFTVYCIFIGCLL